jgi:hypothetical protein
VEIGGPIPPDGVLGKINRATEGNAMNGMNTKTPSKCAGCGGRLETGYLLELAHGGHRSAGNWVEGPPERSWWQGLKLEGRRQLDVTAHRCTDCGRLELYALQGS